MSQILIDRDVLQRLLDEHLELEIEARSFRTLRNRSAWKNLPLVLQFEEARAAEKSAQRVQIQGTYRIMKDCLADGDDNSFQTALASLFPHRK